MAAARRERYSIVLGMTEQIAAPIRAANRRIESMVAPIRKVKNEARALARVAGFGKLSSSIGAVGHQIRRLGTYGVAALGGILYGVQRIGASTDELGKLATQTGFNVEKLQEYEYAASIAGQSSEGFRKSIEQLGKRTGELQAGTGALYTLLSKVDPQFGKLVAGAGSTEQALELVLGRIRSLGDAEKQEALANAAFGRSGLRMVNVAKLGADELGRLRQQAREVGGVLGKGTTDDAAKMVDALTTAKLAVGGLATQIASKLFPVVTEIADSLTAWIVKNRELALSGAVDFIRDFVSAGHSVIGVLREWLPPIVETVKRFGGAKLVLGALAVGVLAPLVIAIGGVVSALGSIAVAVGAVVGPIAAAVGVSTAAFVAMGAALGAVVTTIVAYWDEIKATIFGVVDAISSKVNAFIDLIPEPVRAVLGSVLSGQGLVGAGIRFGAPLLELGTPAAPAAAPAAAAAGAPFGGTGTAELRVRVDQDGRVRGAALDSKGAAIELDQGGALGSEF